MIPPIACGVGDGGHLPRGHSRSHNDALRTKRRTPGHRLGTVGWWVADFARSGYRVFREIRVSDFAFS